jgi:hypothetical protein
MSLLSLRRRAILPLVAALALVLGLVASFSVLSARSSRTSAAYTVLAWNDLGMHCISPRFAEMAILPPYNNLWVQVIQKGEEPRLLTSGIKVTYAFPQNTTTVGKTDFWQYAYPLFGVHLQQGIGITGNGLSGTMVYKATPYPHYEATGIPILPKKDDGTWDPYQQAVVTVKNLKGKTLAQAQVVTPVSDEMNCQKCHADGGVATGGFATGTPEGNILMLHDATYGTHLYDHRPVLCATCHSDNALGTPGTPGVPSLSEAMHVKHGTLAPANQPACYDCHPGANTQCNRSAIEGMGPVSPTDPNCQHCHGDLLHVGQTVQNGRRPWLDEPGCGDCHQGPQMNTGSTLYRMSAGHHDVACAACHNSPHAWYPSMKAADNWQPLTYQGVAAPIAAGNRCFVCHTNQPEGSEGPHGSEGGGGGGGDD